MDLVQIAFACSAFICGALPFSYWIGKYGLKTDIRDFGDGNPGTFNVIRSGGIKWGGLALMLDISKGAAPVGLATHVFGWEGVALIIIAIMPVLGHAFSPFLNFRGGKAIATTGGIWIGLTILEMPLVFIIALVIWYFLLNTSAWATMFTFMTMFAYMLLTTQSAMLFTVLILNWCIVAYKHRHELHDLPTFKIFAGHHTETSG